MERDLLSLVFAGTYCFVVFGIRSLWLWRRSGTAGFRGLSGAAGSLKWWSGVGLMSATVLAFFGPIASIAGRHFDLPLLTALSSPFWLDALAIAAILSGALGTLWAQSSMGTVWRVGVDESERTPLVKHGAFRWVRNPVFSFIILSMLGFALYLPTVATGTAVVLAAISISLQVRLVEEPYLRQQHGEAYVLYANAVGRFLPGIGKEVRA